MSQILEPGVDRGPDVVDVDACPYEADLLSVEFGQQIGLLPAVIPEPPF
jgi:hypothetical protein